jgi:ABC-type Fe3+/spermidine/putrescine transport system ATPase subunit
MALQAIGLGKRFPGVVALSDMSMDVESGKVMALVGANGAGKSTLIKILTGYYNTYEGRIEVDGAPADIHKPSDASKFGIQAVYQEVDTVLVPNLTVAENLLMNETVQDGGHVWMNWGAMNRRATEFLDDLKQLIDFTQAKRGCWLIEYDVFHLMMDGPCDDEHLLLVQDKFLDAALGVDFKVEIVEKLSRTTVHCAPVHPDVAAVLHGFVHE